jgi:hypothetical protein
MKQTAVEFLVNMLPLIQQEGLRDTIEQSLEMEKQQINDAVEWGNRKGYDEHRLTCILDEDEDYYNETYKKPTT